MKKINLEKRTMMIIKIISIIIFLIVAILLGIYSYIYSHENVHLGKYKGLKTTLITYKVNDGDIETSLNELALKYPKQTKKYKGTIKDGTKVNVDYSYTLDNKIMKKEDLDVTVGTDSIGFESKLTGMTVGESTDVIINYGEDNENTDLAGKEITYTIKVNYIIKESTPKITDAFIKKHTDCKTVDEYKEELKQTFIVPYEENAKTVAGNKLISQIIKNTKVKDYPNDEIKTYKKNMKAKYEDAASQMDLTFEELLKYMNITEEDFEKELDSEARFYVNKKLIVKKIAKKHLISVSDKEFEEYLEKISDTYSDFDTVEDVQTYIDENKTEKDLKYDALAEKVIDYLLKHNTVEKQEEEIDYRSISVQMD